MKQLRGAVAVITGAASGIGRALATELASAGAQLALADVSATGLEETRRLLGSATVRTYTVDVGDSAAMEAFAAKVGEDFHRVSLLINNAGVALHGTFAEVSLKDMEWLLRINYWGVVYGCKLFMPLLQREPEAHIVNVSSVFGLIGPPGQTAYASSKFAVRGFTEALRYELNGTNIRVSCVHPGGISTAIADNARLGEKASAQEAAKLKARFKKVTPTTPEEAARVIVKGILNNKPRILIGSDARRIDVLQRLVPIRGVSALVSMMAGRKPARTQKPS